jgi:hypothetical protein
MAVRLGRAHFGNRFLAVPFYNVDVGFCSPFYQQWLQ